MAAVLFVAGAALLALFGPRAPGEVVLAAACYLAVWAAVARDAVRKLFGPVFAYELTRLGRKRGTFVTRFVYVAGIGVLFVYWFFLWSTSVVMKTGSGNVTGPKAAEFADQFFLAYAMAQFGAIFVLAPAFVAGTVAQEKERKTLEFLLATDLSSAEIVFGKAAARLFLVMQFVVAGLGVIVFLQLFGGIDPDLLLASTAASTLAAVGVTALGLYYSVRLRKPRDAILATTLTVMGYVFVSFVASNVVRFWLPGVIRFDPFTLLGWQVGPGDVLWGRDAIVRRLRRGEPPRSRLRDRHARLVLDRRAATRVARLCTFLGSLVGVLARLRGAAVAADRAQASRVRPRARPARPPGAQTPRGWR